MAELAAIIRNSIVLLPVTGTNFDVAFSPLADPDPALPPQFTIATFKKEPQVVTQWCWAAITVAINETYLRAGFPGESLQKCQIVDRQYPGNNCCTNSENNMCNQQGQLKEALKSIDRLARALPSVDIPFEILKHEIAHGRPVGVRILTNDDTYHFVAIYGYAPNYDLLVWDPAGHDQQLRIGEWSEFFGTWLQTYFTK